MIQSGYKQTEIGVIPEDWELGTLKEAFLKLDAGVSVNSDDSESSDYYILKTSAVRNGRVNINEAKPVIRSDYARLKCSVKKGSIIISRMNTPAMVGECGFSTIDAPNTFLPDRLWQIEPSSPDYNFQWLNYLLNTEKYSAAIRATATGTSNSMKNIAKERLLEISIPKPPFPEQQRIAETLSDVDEMIASLEKLIEKKKAIKQGAMQELLTGKRRLPGFSGEWESVSLSEIGHFIKGSGISRADANSGKLPAVRYGELYTKHDNYLKEYYSHISYDVAQTAVPVTYGAILFAASGETKEEIGKCAAIIDDHIVYAGGDLLIFVPDKPIHPVFFGTLLNSPEVCKQKAQRGQGDAIVHIHANSLSKIRVTIPDYEEQTAIAELLLSTDREIDLLETEVTKARKIKQGMMQQLLTGKIRL